MKQIKEEMMNNRSSNETFLNLLLFGVVVITVLMFVSPTFGCTVHEVKIYTGLTDLSACSDNLVEISIPAGGVAHLYAECTITTDPLSPGTGTLPAGYKIRWKFYYNGFNLSLTEETDSLENYAAGPTFSGPDGYQPLVKCWVLDENGAISGSGMADQCKVNAVGIDKIEINSSGWNDVTGDTLTLLKGTKYEFRATPGPAGTTWPSSQPTWKWNGVPIAGVSATVLANVLSNGVLKACCGTSEKQVTINVVEPTVYQVGFSGDHIMYETPAGDGGWADGSTVITDPVYDSSVGPPITNNPVCVTKNSSSVSLYKVKLKTSTALSYPATIVVDASGTEEWNESSNVTITGTTSGLATLAITGNIYDKIKKYDNNFTINWKYKVPTGTNAYYTINSTSHTVYVTWGTPTGSVVTVKRVDKVVTACPDMTSEPLIIDELWSDVIGTTPYTLDVTYPTPEWKMLNGTPGECIAIANLFEEAIKMLGLTPGSGSVVFLYPDTGGGSHESSSPTNYTTRNCTSGNNGHTASIGNTHDNQQNTEELAFVDMGGGSNNWEACYKYRHTPADPWKWYAPGTSTGIFTSVQNVMDAICDFTYWAYVVTPASGGNPTQYGICFTPGPAPEHDW